MRTLVLAAALCAAPLAACTTYGNGSYADDWSRQYRAGTYEPYTLSDTDSIYRGEDGRYYCKRRDGTVGLVVGAGVGAVLGNLIAPHGSKTLGAILGATAGGAAGYAIERDQVRCQ